MKIIISVILYQIFVCCHASVLLYKLGKNHTGLCIFIYYVTNARTDINWMYFPVSERKIRHNLDSSAGSCDSGLYGCAGVLNMHYIEKVWRNLENWTAVIVQYGLIGKRYVKYQGDKKYRTLQEQSIKSCTPWCSGCL